ncbi:hypothetical protein E2562_031653 [Oryza meyeriana var. granulata]|uniref:Uncharacterized protein n=1 Tax=Oryza meyeriana var. granulata TaxID=110450 RepID=A0A6G1E4U2_9ORYZ|nr:hypothetical protein E2562_031653 [Oryza meyeriana var. granulata]
MDLTPPGGFLNLLQDPNMASHFSQSASQVAPVGAQQPCIYAHASFPLFSTQPPPTAPAVQVPPASSTGSRQWHKVVATPEVVDDASKRCTTPMKRISGWLVHGSITQLILSRVMQERGKPTGLRLPKLSIPLRQMRGKGK